MKKTLALLLCLAMLFTALSVNVFAAGTTPTVEIVTNSISGGKTTFAVKINGNPVEGVDIKVDVTGDDAKITGVSAKNFDVTALTQDQDYTISENGKKLHAVGLQKNTTTGEIISVTADATKDFTINVNCDIAKSDTEKVVVSGSASVTAYVEPTTDDVTVSGGASTPVPAPADGYFIPNGAVYYENNGAIDYVEKELTGSFTVNKNAKYKLFKIPTGGFGTYGVRDRLNGPAAKEFGNYVETKQAGKQYGTIVISGDWEGFKNYYITNKGKSEFDLVKLIYQSYFTLKKEDRTYVPFKAGNSIIKVFNVPQSKILWENSEKTKFEYGVRMNNIQPNSDYATIAYYATSTDTADDAVVLSKDIKTTHNN